MGVSKQRYQSNKKKLSFVQIFNNLLKGFKGLSSLSKVKSENGYSIFMRSYVSGEDRIYKYAIFPFKEEQRETSNGSYILGELKFYPSKNNSIEVQSEKIQIINIVKNMISQVKVESIINN